MFPRFLELVPDNKRVLVWGLPNCQASSSLSPLFSLPRCGAQFKVANIVHPVKGGRRPIAMHFRSSECHIGSFETPNTFSSAIQWKGSVVVDDSPQLRTLEDKFHSQHCRVYFKTCPSPYQCASVHSVAVGFCPESLHGPSAQGCLRLEQPWTHKECVLWFHMHSSNGFLPPRSGSADSLG